MSNLYIVSTPIGNLQDITLRAANVLLSSRIIIAESTSKAGLLLEFLKKTFPEIPFTEKRIISLTEDEEESKIGSIILEIQKNDAALISEAGTPLISDPGFKLVRSAIKHGINIIPIPGVTAAIAALTGSGLPTDKFLFLGFLPKSSVKKEAIMTDLKNSNIKTTIVVYESADRILDTVKIVLKILGDVDMVIARELTKVHEEFIRGKTSQIVKKLSEKNLKGEITLLFSSRP